MESLLSLFIFHDTYVVSFLVVAIAIVIVMLLLFNQKSPKSVVDDEIGGGEAVEGALRRVLSEKNWGGATSGGGDEKVVLLQKEVLEKDRTIADLNKQITQGGGDGAALSGDQSDLLERIAELEARLQEYEIIEDDIADLSLYRTENEKLKAELENLKGQVKVDIGAGAGEVKVVAEEEPPREDVVMPMGDAAEVKQHGNDLVAEFEKVVNSQDQMAAGDGDVQVVDTEQNSKPAESIGEVQKVHPKLQNISPDSKEEAEVFIAELKSLKKADSQ